MVLLKPVDDIMEKLGITPYTLGLSDDHDEFFRLNSALDSLTAQVSEVHSVLHEKEQLVRERLLLGILHASVDVTALPQEYMKYGLVFPYRFFSLILIHMPALEIMEDFTKKEQLRLVVLSSASEAFSVLGKAYGIHTNGQNIGILLNTSIAEAELTAELKRLCSAISQRMQQTLSIDPFFSIVLCEQASPSYQKSWQLARRNLLFTSPETEDFMIIGHQEDLTSSLDSNLSIQLSRALIDRDQAAAHKIADSFFSRYLETANTQEARKLTTILLCEVYVALLDFGDDIPDTQLSPYLKKLENTADPSECSRIFFSCIQGLLNAKTKNLHGSSYLYLPGNFLYPAALQGGAFRPSDRGRRWFKPGLSFQALQARHRKNALRVLKLLPHEMFPRAADRHCRHDPVDQPEGRLLRRPKLYPFL